MRWRCPSGTSAATRQHSRPTTLTAAILASCSIPFWLQAVHDVPGGPRGAHWDGGITDYHLHLPHAAMREGRLLYPHFQRHVELGSLNKAWMGRHRSSPRARERGGDSAERRVARQPAQPQAARPQRLQSLR